MAVGFGIQVILWPLLQQFEKSSVVYWWRDLWSVLLRGSQVSWYTYQTDSLWCRQSQLFFYILNF
jgi:hypothetical protein